MENVPSHTAQLVQQREHLRFRQEALSRLLDAVERGEKIQRRLARFGLEPNEEELSAEWARVYDERLRVEREILAAQISSEADLIVKLDIICGRNESTPPNEMLVLLAQFLSEAKGFTPGAAA